ncbi:flagellar hook-length control protein FliK [Grimontia kaedaensis]|uniref:Flagellar hook-length control protein FliK n=1 Tax=Grimontia kaedaensis TaxID=2872157 RepID=A0ABY4WUQ5_9GAMM|nr:flagellar hook-length control protein FliK [Grimontia kaedaensis]USH03194.1 flagellar hook-length control protein FliK [Grimontia kaedaensis]
MSQTSFLLSGLSNSKAPMGEGKAVMSPEVSESEGEGFFAQLAQLVSGDGEAEAVSGEKAVATEGDAASEKAINAALTKSLASAEGEDAEKLALDEGIFDADGEEVAVKPAIDGKSDAEVLKATKAIDSGDESIANRQQVAKQDGEVLLQRLNESNQVLQTKPEEASPELKVAQVEAVKADGKSLPQQAKNSEALPEEVKAALALQAQAPKAELKAATRQSDGKLPSDMAKPPLDKAVEAEVDALLSKPVNLLTDEEKLVIQQLIVTAEKGSLDVLPESGVTQAGTKPLSDAELIAAVDALRASTAQEIQPDTPTVAAPVMAQAASMVAANGDVEITPEMMAKASQSPEWAGTKAQQDMMMRAQMAAASTMNGEPDKALAAELQAKGLIPTAQANMSQAASAVQAAVNPQTQPTTPMSAFAAIPWTPAAMQNGANQPQPAASQAVLEATAAQQPTETTRPGTEVKADHLAQQLASSFGQQAGATAAKLDAAAAQTPLQMSQNQTEAANALSERVNMMMSKNLKHVDIRLDPPELGRLQIKLSVNSDQASVQFTVANQAARDLVEQSMPRLREMMQQQGLQLAQSSVQHQDSGGRQSFAGNQAQQGEGQGGQNGQGHSSGFGRGDEQDADHSVTNHDLYVNTPKDRVDYYA